MEQNQYIANPPASRETQSSPLVQDLMSRPIPSPDYGTVRDLQMCIRDSFYSRRFSYVIRVFLWST